MYHRWSLPWILISLLCTLSFSAAAIATAATEEPQLLRNFGQVTPQVFRSAGLYSEEAFAEAAGMGFTHIINMQWSWHDDPQFCAKYNLKCLHFPILFVPFLEGAFGEYDLTLIGAFVKVRQLERKGRKVLIHCWHGSDRTGALAAALTIAKHLDAGEYNRIEVQQEVSADLSRHKFHWTYFYSLGLEILSWVLTPPLWLYRDQVR